MSSSCYRWDEIFDFLEIQRRKKPKSDVAEFLTAARMCLDRWFAFSIPSSSSVVPPVAFSRNQLLLTSSIDEVAYFSVRELFSSSYRLSILSRHSFDSGGLLDLRRERTRRRKETRQEGQIFLCFRGHARNCPSTRCCVSINRSRYHS